MGSLLLTCCSGSCGGLPNEIVLRCSFNFKQGVWPYAEPYHLPLLGFIIINKLDYGWVLWCVFSYSLKFSFFYVSLSYFFFWKYLSDSLDFPMETDFVDCSRILLTMLLV